MTKRSDDDDQRRDALLRQVMKSPPLTREQFKTELKRAREAERAAKRARGSRAEVERPAPRRGQSAPS